MSSRRIALLLSLGFATAAAHAQAPADIDAVMKLSGEARINALAEGARKEGEVMVYHSSQTEDLKPVFDAFTRKYGIKIRDWRSSSENVVQRVINETRAGKRDVDLIENNAPEQEALVREKMLRPMALPSAAMRRAASTMMRRNSTMARSLAPNRSRARSAIGPMVSHMAMSCMGMPRMPVKSPSLMALRSCRKSLSR